MTKTAAPATDAPAPKSKKNLIIAVLAALLLAGGGAAGWYFFLKPKNADSGHEEKKPLPPAGPPVFSVLDPFTVNLEPEGKFLQATFTLQLETPDDLQRLKSYLPQVRGRLLLLLAGKEGRELITTEGKNQLITEITENVQTPFSEGQKPVKVMNVFITSFVIQ